MAVKSLAQSSLIHAPAVNSMLGDYDSNYFHHLETVRLAATASSITFSNLGQYSDYQHLQIRAITRQTASNTVQNCFMQFNGDTGSNYSRHVMFGEGSAVPAYGYPNTSYVALGYGTSGNSSSGAFGAEICDILDAFDITKYTTTRSIDGLTGGYNLAGLQSGSWRNTDAISSILIFSESSTFAAGSRFSLYGLKARS